MEKALFVGRFQPLHIGHLDAIANIRKDGYKPIIGIGSPDVPLTSTNPFTLEERKQMIRADVKGEYEIAAIQDVGNDLRWLRQIEGMGLGFQAVYSCNPNTLLIFERAGYATVRQPEVFPISATKVRGLMFAGRDWKRWVGAGTRDLLERINAESTLRSFKDGYKTFGAKLTVDGIAENGGNLLLIKRGHWPYEGMLALPGGHVDYGENPRDAVVRELWEETGLEFAVGGIVDIYSDVERDPRGWYCSVTYHGHAKGIPKAGDDAASVMLVPIEEARKRVYCGGARWLAFDHDKMLRDAFEKGVITCT